MEVISELGKEKFAEFLALYKKTQLSICINFIKFYKVYADAVMDENKEISILTFKKFLIDRNTEFVLRSYEWFREMGLMGEYLN